MKPVRTFLLVAMALGHLWADVALAEVVAPASSENIQDFDNLLANQHGPRVSLPKGSEAIGQAVAAEAQKLRDATTAQRTAFGKNIGHANARNGASGADARSGRGGVADAHVPLSHANFGGGNGNGNGNGNGGSNGHGNSGHGH